MGQELECKVRFGGKAAMGKALLESEELLFRGGMRLKIPFRAMKSIQSAGGELRIEFPEGTAIFELGPQAQKWAEKILHPKSLLDKLGVKPGAVVSVIAVRDERFLKQLRERTNEIGETPRSESDWIFLGAESKESFSEIRPLTKSLKKTGGLWIVYPKGQKHITEEDVLGAGKKAGLVDVKVVGFSATHTALKFVVPVSSR
ncbi:MAG TPA: hypothetical protein VF860_05890 [Candidatus Acidoferrales bacterium]